MGVWEFIQNQVLGMKWLNELIGMGLSTLGLDMSGRIGSSIQFFIYDVLKITFLLCGNPLEVFQTLLEMLSQTY